MAAASPGDAAEIDELGRRLAETLADVPRGYAHGDFWPDNLLVEDGRLVGVVDWDYGGAGRLPVLDLFHLLVNGERSRRQVGIGRAIADYLLAGSADAAVRDYCERVGVEPGHLGNLAHAYWLDYVARQLELYADRAARPVWMEENVSGVLAAVRARRRSAA